MKTEYATLFMVKDETEIVSRLMNLKFDLFGQFIT